MQILAITSSREISPSPAIRGQLAEIERLGVRVDRMSVPPGRASTYLMAAARNLYGSLIKGKQYDVIHGFYGHCGAVARVQRGTPVVVTFQGSDLLGGTPSQPMFRRDGFIGRTVARLADAVIVMSEEMKRASRREDAVVLPFGIDTKTFRPMPQAEARALLGLPQVGKLVLFPWHPSRPEKNHGTALEAVGRLQLSGENVELVTLFAKEPRIVALYMNACDALIMVSAHEGSPVAVREAMACALPVVSVDVGDVATVIRGASGCSIVERSPDAVASGLRIAFKVGRSFDGASRISTFDIEWSARQVLQIYQGLSRTRKGAGRAPATHDG